MAFEIGPREAARTANDMRVEERAGGRAEPNRYFAETVVQVVAVMLAGRHLDVIDMMIVKVEEIWRGAIGRWQRAKLEYELVWRPNTSLAQQTPDDCFVTAFES